MNLHYECMCSTGAICQNGGFRHPRNCNLCICPSGFGGPTCSGLAQPENGAANIGSILTAQAYLQTLSGKTGDPTKILQTAQIVHWHITAPVGTRIEINIQSVTGQCNVGCAWGSLDVKIKNFNLVGSRFCCTSDVAANPKLISADNFAIISLYSQAYEHSFSLQYQYIYLNSENSTATPSLTSTTPSACVDVFNDCQRYDVTRYSNPSVNSPEGYAWQMKNCAKHCGACNIMSSTTTKTTTVTPTSNTTCVDVFNDCKRFDVAIFCNAAGNTPEGYVWQMKNCAKHCGACGK